jgi:predicted transcriptional regulator
MPRKKKNAKDWYWEAEQDKIAADENLKLIRSPDDGPAEGLDCVGLYFLMLNEMARSVRKGYLLSPADDRKPMSATELAVLTGRSAAVISRTQAVILQRGLFSKTDTGIVYSRGMVRKEELRKKRAKCGKKGGLRTGDLLKQIVEQNGQQNLGIGIEIQSPSSNLPEEKFAQAKSGCPPSAHDLAVKWCFMRRGTGKESAQDAAEVFAGMIAVGISSLAIDAEIDSPKRDRAEYLWEFRKRVKGLNHAKPVDTKAGFRAVAEAARAHRPGD